jgi:two-component system response regulator FixJ
MSDKQLVHIVDDDPAVRDALALLLRTEGLAAQAYASALAFLENVGTHDQGCVVTDICMPVMSGIDLLATMKDRRFAMPAIAMTAHGNVLLAVEALEMGAVDFIEKPFDSEVLVAVVRKALAQRAQDRRPSEVSEEIRARFAALSRIETEVMNKLFKGATNKIVAYELGVSLQTVEIHRANLMSKMKAESLSALVKFLVAVHAADGAGN